MSQQQTDLAKWASVILGVAVVICGTVYTYANVTATVQQHTERILVLDTAQQAMVVSMNALTTSQAVANSNQARMSADITEIKAMVKELTATIGERGGK